MPYLGRILLQWLGLATLSGSFVVTPVANAQAPVINIPADLDILAANEAFDPVANPPWTTKALMPTHRDDFAISEVDGIIYVAGGETFNNCIPIDTVEAYDPIMNTWTTKAPMPTPRFFAGAGTANGKMYVVGGQLGCEGAVKTVEAYDPSNDMWSTPADMLADMPTARHSMGIAVIHDTILNRDILYAIGGAENTGNQNVPVNTVEAYDPVTNIWTTKTAMSQKRFQPVVGVVNGKIYAIGGFDENFTQASDQTVEEYDPLTNNGLGSWIPKAPVPTLTARGVHPAAGVVNNIIYVVGGIDQQATVETALSLVQAYDPSIGINGQWTTVPDYMPTARVNLGVAVVNNTLYAVGGNFPGVARVGKQFIYQITASNHPISYTANNLPPELTFDTALGLIYGTPQNPFDSSVDFTATNADGTGPTASARLVVLPSPASSPAPVIISSTCATARTDHPFSFQVSAENTSSSAQFTAGGLPPGLIMDRDTGLIHGTPTADGNFGVAVSLTDGPTTTQALLQLTCITDMTVPIITSSDSKTLVPGQFSSYIITADAAASFSYIGTDGLKHEGPSPTCAGLPSGLCFDGIATISGTYTGGSGSSSGNGIVTSSATPLIGGNGTIQPNTITKRPPLIQLIATINDTGAGGTGTAPLNFFGAEDTTPPVITVPANMTVRKNKIPKRQPQGAVVSFSVSATDLVDGSVTATANPPSGSFFPLGTTMVVVTATDSHGNTATASFTVTVVKKIKKHKHH